MPKNRAAVVAALAAALLLSYAARGVGQGPLGPCAQSSSGGLSLHAQRGLSPDSLEETTAQGAEVLPGAAQEPGGTMREFVQADSSGLAAAQSADTSRTLPSYRMEEIRVTASRLSASLERIPADVTVVGRREVEANSDKSLVDLLGRKVGVNAGSYGALGAVELMSLRGGRSGRTPTMIDGILVNSAQNGALDFNTIPASLVQRIEIVRGPLGVLHGGNGIVGIVNFVTATPGPGQEPTSLVGVSSGSYGHRKHVGTFRRSLGRVGMVFGIEGASSGEVEPYKDYSAENYFGKLTYGFEPGPNLALLALNHNGVLRSLSGSEQETDAARVQLTSRAPVGARASVGYGAFWASEAISYEDPYVETKSDLDKYGSFLDVNLDGTVAGDVTCGGGFIRNGLSVKDLMSSWSPATKEGYVFASSRFQTAGWLATLFSLRVDLHSDYGNELSPCGSIWHDGENAMVWLTAGRGFNPPTMNDLFWPRQETHWGEWTYITRGNEGLSAESSWMGEVGSRFSLLGDHVRGSATCFAARTEDYIQWESSVSSSDLAVTFEPVNTEQVDAIGAELAVDVASRGIPVAGMNLTLQRVEDAGGTPLPYMPESRLNLWFERRFEPLPELEMSLSLDATLIGKHTESMGSTVGPFFILEEKLSGSIAGFTAFIRLRNATDETYPSRYLKSPASEGKPASYFPMPGRGYEFGILWTLLD